MANHNRFCSAILSNQYFCALLNHCVEIFSQLQRYEYMLKTCTHKHTHCTLMYACMYAHTPLMPFCLTNIFMLYCALLNHCVEIFSQLQRYEYMLELRGNHAHTNTHTVHSLLALKYVEITHTFL